nr:ribonuclease H-like domain-containing protein [Tanacetum cinerariifolium]
NADFEDYSEDSSNNVSAAGLIVPTVGQNYSNNTNPFSAAGPSNTNISPTHGKPSLNVASQLYDNFDMLEMEDIAYSDHENRVRQALKDPSWIKAMHEELLQFKMQNVWILVDLPHELNGGYVSFGGNPKGGKISDFKLPDESQVLLRVPRENNMYNVNLKDIVPSRDLTCLFAKPESTVNLSLSSSALSGEQDDMTNKKDKGKIPTARQNYSNSTNPISAVSPSNTNTSPTHGKYLLQDASQPLEMLEKEDIAYSDHENVGVEADFNNFGNFYHTEILKKFGLTEGKSASTPIDTEKPLLKDPD